MKKIVYLFLLLAVIACSTVPLTNRTQITAIPSSQMLSLSSSSYNDVLSQSQISTNAAYRSSVERVGLNISAAVESYLKEIGRAELLQGYDWEFNVIKSDQLNAWCMPGGKIAFYEGIIPICKDDNGIAVVMAHEIAHAVAKHNNERMTQQLGLQMGGLALSEALSEKETQTKQIAMAVFGVGSQVGIILPYSRSFENEPTNWVFILWQWLVTIHVRLRNFGKECYRPEELERRSFCQHTQILKTELITSNKLCQKHWNFIKTNKSILYSHIKYKSDNESRQSI